MLLGTGTSANTHISVFVSLLEGKHDAEVNWAVVRRITLTLLYSIQPVIQTPTTTPTTTVW